MLIGSRFFQFAWRSTTLALGLFSLTSLAPAAPVIQNPSFEVDDVPGYPGYKSDITNWTTDAQPGNNTGINDISGPFHNGLIPDGTRVALIQNQAKLTQSVDGFQAGKQYILTYFENGRDGNLPTGQISLGDKVIVPEHEVPPGGAGNPYYFKMFTFDSPGTGAFDLVLEQTKGPDNTICYDMFNIAEVGSAPNILLGKASLDFGSGTVNDHKDAKLIIYNNGGSALTINSFGLTGTDKAQFSVVSPTDKVSIDPGKSQEVTVRFSPTSKDAKTATLEVNSNDPDTPKVSLAMTGKGVAGVEVTNGSFEIDPLPANPGYTTKITGWMVSGGCGFHDYDSANGGYSTFHDNGATPDGKMVAFIQGNGKFTQSVPGFVKGNLYRVSIWVNRRASTPAADASNPAPFRMTLGGQALFNSSTPLLIMSVAALGDFTVPFIHYEQTLAAPASGNLDLVIEHVGPTGDISLLFDNVTITPTVNESRHWSFYE